MGGLMRDERGIIGIIGVAIIGILALFSFSALAAINWQFLLAMMAMGIVALAFVGVLFFKADFKLVILAAVVSLGIVFIVEVSLPVIVGAIIVGFGMWKISPAKQPMLFVGMVGLGLLVMVWAYRAMILGGMLP